MKKAFVCIGISIILLFLSSCSSINSEPPTVERMKESFSEHEADFQAIADYLIMTCADLPDFKSATIKDGKITQYRLDPDGVQLNKTETSVADSPIADNCKRLKQAGCKDIGMCISGKETQNAVCFTMWSRDIKQAECGIAYSVNGTDPPVIQFKTELSPIAKDRWYYFLADYEEWRNTKPTFNPK
ncbi:hypothetical protein [Ruminococcus sp.]|uniref:hypothetical protein n=1 Tax=Ruminococcus sp. TaxID=41978 RepID=UPI0038683B78